MGGIESSGGNYHVPTRGNTYMKGDVNAAQNDWLNSPEHLAGMSFDDWKKAKLQSGIDYQTYLDAVEANPGRQGTILVPTTPTQPGDAPPPTLLTANKKKTVLG